MSDQFLQPGLWHKISFPLQSSFDKSQKMVRGELSAMSYTLHLTPLFPHTPGNDRCVLHRDKFLHLPNGLLKVLLR